MQKPLLIRTYLRLHTKFVDSCDYLITSKMYLLKLSKKELEMFNIYTYNFSNKDNNMIMPEKYEYSEKSLS